MNPRYIKSAIIGLCCGIVGTLTGANFVEVLILTTLLIPIFTK